MRIINNTKQNKPKIKHRGIHAKTKQSNNKGSDLYVKPYHRQGNK